MTSKKYTVRRTSTEEVIVEAANEEEALEKAYDAEREAFVEVDYDWEVVS